MAYATVRYRGETRGGDFTKMGQLSRPAIYEARVAECEAAAAATADARVRAKLLQRAGQWRRLARKNDMIRVSANVVGRAAEKNIPLLRDRRPEG